MRSAKSVGIGGSLAERVVGEVRDNEPLGRWSTYRIGGTATMFFPANSEDVAHALRFATEHDIPWFALGLGSNLLFPDQGVDALVIRVGKGLDGLEQDGDRWVIGAGLPAPLAAKRTAAAGWGGIHKMVGVPGSVGGGVVMNAGCHGAEWRDVVESVLLIDRQGVDHTLSAVDAGFNYRQSRLGHGVVVETAVRLVSSESAELVAETDELYRWRREGTPFKQPCCGSVFKNPALPEEWPADAPRTSGQFIEAAGLKGVRVGGVAISELHANYFVNTGGGTAEEVKELMRKARDTVADRWGVVLDPEVKLIGKSGTVIEL